MSSIIYHAISGMMGVFLQDGVIVDKFDEQSKTIYLSVPEDSFAYHDFHTDTIIDAESYAKAKKKALADLLRMPDLKLQYKTYSGYWTKEQGDKNYREHIQEFL